MILDNIFDQTLTLINNTTVNIFLSGKAGTGKTTFIKSLHDRTYKKFVITAPTGVAALNANGITLHSLFNLPLNLIPSGNTQVLENIVLDLPKRTLLAEMELLVIDEVSMLRADVLDSIDYLLKKFRKSTNKAFGGVQVLFIGDLYQLSPVVKNKEWELMKNFYKSPFFVDAKVLREIQPILLELNDVFRQSDIKFIRLLNKIRNNTISTQELNVLNLNLLDTEGPEITNSITLTSHNIKANLVNNENLSKLEGMEFRIEANIDGSFDSSSYPVEKTLVLKIGAMVMLIKNDTGQDKKYFNGKIGIIKDISENNVSVLFGDNEIIDVEREIWLNTEYNYDHENDRIVQTDKGSFQQFPLRLAWAITIHKSQGLSFDSAIIDISGAFTAGHVYVALSRVRSLQGLLLKSPLDLSIISVSPRVTNYYQSEAVKLDEKILNKEASKFIEVFLTKSFSWENIIQEIEAEKDPLIPLHAQITGSIQNQNRLSEKFKLEIQLYFEGSRTDIQQLYERVGNAVDYFIPRLEGHIIKPLKAFHLNFSEDLNYKKYMNFSRRLLRGAEVKSRQFRIIKLIMPELIMSKKLGDILLKVISNNPNSPQINKKVPLEKLALSTEQISLTFFKEGFTIDQISVQRNLPKVTIEKHLTYFLETGEIHINSLISFDELEAVRAILYQDETKSLAYIKQQMGNTLSFGQIKAGMIYHKLNMDIKNTLSK